MTATTACPSLPSKVAELEDAGFWVEQEVLRLDVPMTHPICMDVGQRAKQLVHVQLHREKDMEILPHLSKDTTTFV